MILFNRYSIVNLLKKIVFLFSLLFLLGFTNFENNSTYECINKWTTIASGANVYRPDANGTFVEFTNDILIIKYTDDQWNVHFQGDLFTKSNGFNISGMETEVSVGIVDVKFGKRNDPNAGHERYITYVYEYNQITQKFSGKIKNISLNGGSYKAETTIEGVCKAQKKEDWLKIK